MSDGIYEPVNDDENDAEVLDLDQAFGEDRTDEILDTSWSPPERPRAMDSFGTTLEEEMAGESLDQRLAQEEPDPALAVDPVEGEILDDGEVGGPRAGRLVAPDEGAHEDTEKDLVASDVGIDAGAASAEEAAVHVVDGDATAVDEGSSV
ncbi:DUF5709 domain-containing protein [Kineosporia sp. A_224]|uniref:DUF5709 domain-containing protein n=1 Tax=Kineosporia sp. A_224 TaxID=1962180 RepID=UPI000B4A65A0|nr:DUF5709 domain-containing protein [Kineosporia sp. A_224]